MNRTIFSLILAGGILLASCAPKEKKAGASAATTADSVAAIPVKIMPVSKTMIAYQRLLDYIVPDKVHVLAQGRIIRSGGPELAHELEERGYAWLLEGAAGGQAQGAAATGPARAAAATGPARAAAATGPARAAAAAQSAESGAKR